jgi:hypothetical protein
MPKVPGSGPVLAEPVLGAALVLVEESSEVDSVAAGMVEPGGTQAATSAITGIQRSLTALTIKLTISTIKSKLLFTRRGHGDLRGYARGVRSTAFALLGLVLGACEGRSQDRELRLGVDATAVEPLLPELGVLSVEVYGVRDTTSLCTLARRCLYPLDLGSPQSGADLQAALREVVPLVEVDAAVAHQIAVVGRAGGLCDEQGPFLVCGFADLGTARGDALDVALADDLCPAQLPAFCPP